ncbi:DUF6327 family protein [Aquimarina spongiae]|uniref:Glutaminyl-tRNA synthetase n=1 Tax=Aquimarina spongiae TaxID=570521 RepID=A0A1M6GNA7_9FLAO|nr:DUF6327 family protein [Aquimarina spongiae]SHJ11445.1 hypothetical protein SAMN04488508_105365 [Aquimarina spongiae]
MEKTYNSFKEIEQDLRKLNLQRKISFEQMKLVKHELKEDLQPYNWVITVLNSVKKYGILYIIRKIFK